VFKTHIDVAHLLACNAAATINYAVKQVSINLHHSIIEQIPSQRCDLCADTFKITLTQHHFKTHCSIMSKQCRMPAQLRLTRRAGKPVCGVSAVLSHQSASQPPWRRGCPLLSSSALLLGTHLLQQQQQCQSCSCKSGGSACTSMS
jgi:hypothetical protein